jgi:hypothetical protein
MSTLRLDLSIQFQGYTIIRQYARDQPFPFDFKTAMAKQGVVLQTAVYVHTTEGDLLVSVVL